MAEDVLAALESLGWVVPRSESEVRRAESELAADPAPLPPGLTDPAGVLDGPDPSVDGSAPAIPFPRDVEIDATLARVAREGGEITPAIEEAMRRDREAAEREAESDMAAR